MSSHPYLLGSGDLELDRLARQHDVWRGTTEKLWQAANFGPGQRILDLGCGPGFASFELSERTGPGGQIIAMDSSERFVGVLKSWCKERGVSNIDARLGDAYSPGIEPGSLDGIFIRWLLCFLPDTQRIIRAAADALTPGGQIVTLDYFHYLSIQCFPSSEIFSRVFRRIYQSFQDAGGDLDVGGKLPGQMQDAGLEILHLQPVIEAVRPGSAIWQWVRAFQKGYLPQLVEKGYLSAEDLVANDRDWLMRSEDPASFFLSPPMLGIVARKPG